MQEFAVHMTINGKPLYHPQRVTEDALMEIIGCTLCTTGSECAEKSITGLCGTDRMLKAIHSEGYASDATTAWGTEDVHMIRVFRTAEMPEFSHP